MTTSENTSTRLRPKGGGAYRLPEFLVPADSGAKIAVKRSLLKRSRPRDVRDMLLGLATRIQGTNGKKAQTCLVASSVPGEGATFIALNLASALSSLNSKPVLFADFNARSSIFDSADSQRVTELLDFLSGSAQTVDTDGIVYQTDVENLHFMTFGSKGADQLSEWFGTERFKALLDQLCQKYAFIIIDGAPINPYPDSLQISQHTDGVALVIQAHQTRHEVVNKAKQALEGMNAHILGVVVNQKKHIIPKWIYKRM